MRRVVAATALAIGLVALAAAAWVLDCRHINLTRFHIPLRAHDPWRSSVTAVVAFVVSFEAGGRTVVTGGLAAADRVDDRMVAGVLATATCIVGIAYATTVAGAADPYGYVSEADLWLKGELKIPQPWAQQAPWPSSRGAFPRLGTGRA